MKKYSQLYTLNENPESVKRVFGDIEVYCQYHPLIISVKKKRVDGDRQGYEITERPFGTLPLKIRYEVLVLKMTEGIEYEILGLPFHKVKFRYQISRKNPSGETEIGLDIFIEGIIILERFLAWRMIEAQKKLIKNIKNSS